VIRRVKCYCSSVDGYKKELFRATQSVPIVNSDNLRPSPRCLLSFQCQKMAEQAMRYRGYFSTRSKSLLCFTRNKKAEKRRSHESCCCFSITSRVTVVHKAKVVRTVLYAVIHALYLFSYALDKPVFQCFSKLLLQNDALSPPRRIARHEETSACELVENVGIMRYRMMLCHVCTLNAVLARSWQQSSLEPTLQVLVLMSSCVRSKSIARSSQVQPCCRRQLPPR